MAFCLNHHLDHPETYLTYNVTNDFTKDPDFKKSARLAYLGYYRYSNSAGNASGTGRSDSDQYAYTANLIWQSLGQVPSSYSLGDDFNTFKSQVMDEYNKWDTMPSFYGTTQNLEIGQTKTLTDSKGVLKYYESFNFTKDGVTFSHSKGNNSMTIKVADDVVKENVSITQEEARNNKIGKYINNVKVQTNFVLSPISSNTATHQRLLIGYGYNDPKYLALNINIEQYGRLELKKLGENGELIDGATFLVTGENGFSKEVTVTNGKIILENLKKGTFSIKELSAPTGYLLDLKTYQVEVEANKTATQSIVNREPTGSFTITKYNENKSATITGVKYRIWNDSGYNQEFTTNNEGKITVTGLKLGKYYYQEIESVNGYLIDNTKYSFELKYKDQNTSVVYGSADRTNQEPTGEIQIEKTDKDTGNKNRVDKTSHHGDATLKGAEYTLYAKNDIYNVARTIKYFSTDEEIAKFTFNEYGVASIKITNTATSAKLNVSGSILKGLPMGNFYSKETKIPTGYTKDTNIYDYTLSYKDEETPIIKTNGTVTNIVQKAPFEVIKVSTNSNSTAEIVPNAEFTAILTKYVDYYGSFDEAKKHLDEFEEDEYSIFTTKENGHGVSSLLAYGEYTVNETYTPSPEILTVEQFYVTIDKDSKTPIKELVENDLPFEAYIKMQKQDKKTGKFVTYSNATFELYRQNENTKEWEQVQCKVKDNYFKSWTTNSDGVAKTETKLEAGNYKLSEIKIPTGFIQLDGELTFKVDNRNSTLNYDKDFDAWITVTVNNEQPVGTLELTKKVTLRKDVDKTMIKDIDFTKISFELVTDETIIDYADGSTIYEKGAVVGNYNLKADGTLTIANLPMGKYHLKELTTIEGAVLDETEHKIVFEQKDTITKEYIVEADIENKTTVIEISKTDITGEKELVGAKLTVTNEKNEIIDSWVSTEKTHYIEGLEVGKTYTLIEEIAPEEYVKATSIKFTVENTSEIQKVVMVDKQVTMSKEDIVGNEIEGAELKVVDKDQNIVDSWTSTKQVHKIKGLTEGETYTLYEEYAPDGFVISNEVTFTVTTDKETQKVEMIDKVVEISKINIAGEELEGATLVVTSTKTRNIVDKWVSTKEAHKVSGLIEGESYILHEEIAVDGYVKATDIEFTVTEDKGTQKIQMVDKVVKIIKTDLVTGEELEGAELKVVDEDENIIDSWTSTKIPHKVVGLEEGKNYKLIEITSPYGFEIAEEISFTVTEEKETQRVEMKDMPILTDIQLVKVDSKTKEVIKAKFKFGLYEDESCTKLIKEFKSNKDTGTITFDSLRYGTVFVKELTSPKGYTLSDKVIKVEVNDQGVFVDSNKIEAKDNIYSFEFENQKVPVIQTGNETNYILLSILAATSLIGMIVGIIRVKNKKKFNK